MVSSTTLVRAEARESEPTGAPVAGLKPLTFHTHPLLQFRLKTSQELGLPWGGCNIQLLHIRSGAGELGASPAPPLSHLEPSPT